MGVPHLGVEFAAFLALRNRVEGLFPLRPAFLGNEGDGIDGEQGVAVDSQQGTRGGIGVDDSSIVAIDGQEGVADAVDGRHDSPSACARGAGGAATAMRSSKGDAEAIDQRIQRIAHAAAVVAGNLGGGLDPGPQQGRGAPFVRAEAVDRRGARALANECSPRVGAEAPESLGLGCSGAR